jgi:hypothetical protein
MPEDVVRRNELRPGIPQIREVGDVEGEVNRLSREGWIAVLWPRLPLPSEAIDLLVLTVARTAKRSCREHPPHWTPDAWSRAAKALLAQDQLPIPMDFGRELTLNRLIRWLEPETRALVMGVSNPGQEIRTVEVLGEWFSRAAEAGCLILMPSSLKEPSRLLATFRSEAERLLFNAMDRDPFLHDLFEPNVQVLTQFQTSPCVDLLWREGKVIIEIDSYFTRKSSVGPIGGAVRLLVCGCDGRQLRWRDRPGC